MQDKAKLALSIVLEGDPILFNQYGVMIVNPAKHKHVDYRLARDFVIWLTSPAGQLAIGAFKDAKGNALFTPNAR
jgi:tungstate transport system substrate-binding protein